MVTIMPALLNNTMGRTESNGVSAVPVVANGGVANGIIIWAACAIPAATSSAIKKTTGFLICCAFVIMSDLKRKKCSLYIEAGRGGPAGLLDYYGTNTELDAAQPDVDAGAVT
jgi:hypothetical protein